MNVIRFSDLVAQGRVRGQRVFIRADLNVPQDDAGAITEDTRIRASVPCIRMALDAGAAVMVTVAPGPPDRGRVQARGFAGAGGRSAWANCWAARCRSKLGRRRGRAARPGGAAGELPRQQGREEERRSAGAQDGRALRHLTCNDAFGTAHRAEATTYGIAQFAPIACAGPLLAAEIDAITQALATRSGRWWPSWPAAR
jgi:phosphoglycerate kinase